MNVNFCKKNAVHNDHAKDSANHLQKSRLCTSVPVIFVNLYFKISFSSDFWQLYFLCIQGSHRGKPGKSISIMALKPLDIRCVNICISIDV